MCCIRTITLLFFVCALHYDLDMSDIAETEVGGSTTSWLHLIDRLSKNLYTRAAKFELENDWNNAFELYLQAADSFLHISRTAENSLRYRNKAAKALERAEKIKQHKNLTPKSVDHFSLRK